MPKHLPFFSIIIPTYNRAPMLLTAVNSVIQQSFTDWELIIIDDGSTDNTSLVINSLRDNRIRYFFQENQGRGGVRNKGIAKAKGLYVTFLDDDDYYLPTHLTTLNLTIKLHNTPIGLIRTEAYIEDNEGEKKLVPTCPIGYQQAISFIWQKGAGVVFFAFHKDTLLDFRFDSQYTYAEDLHLILRVLLHFPIYFTKQRTLVITEHPERSLYELSSTAIKKNFHSRINVTHNLISSYGYMLKLYISPLMLYKRYYRDYKFTAVNAWKSKHYFLLFSLLISTLFKQSPPPCPK